MARGDVDLEALETALRDAALGQAAKALGVFMTSVGRNRGKEPVLCPKCHMVIHSTGPRTKDVLTTVGNTAYTRLRYECSSCEIAWYPGDEALDIVGTSRSPGVRRQVARLGAKEPFHEVAEDLQELAGITLSRKNAERISEAVGSDIEVWDSRERTGVRFEEPPPVETPKTIETLYIEVDGTNIPMVPRELEGRKGKQADGSSKSREVKLGCVFTQTVLNEEGEPVRDPASTTFTGAIEEAASFGWRMYTTAVRRGLFKAWRVVMLGDGAEWITRLTDTHFSMATRIVDFYHAKEHVAELCRTLFSKPDRIALHREQWWSLLAEGDIEAIVEQASAYLSKDVNDNKDARRELAYLTKNKEYMRYRAFRNQGLFIGSGVIEAGCKNLIGKRLKQSGMEWTVPGANSIIALRCATLSKKFQEYWDKRAA